MNMTHYEALDERLYRTVLPNGLTVVVSPRPDFQRKVAYFVTNYGSIHTKFTLDGAEYETPAGVAHYLEHKLFDMPGRDVSEEFAALGASPNAFTSYDTTAYYFSCTEHFEASLALLLEFVSTPYFTPESVDKERGIIAQEIRMYADSPDSQVVEDLMEGMYHAHPVRTGIAGSLESIEQITPETLYLCHRAFYHPSNVILCVAGDVDPQAVERIARQMTPDTPKPALELPPFPPEALTCPQPYRQRRMDVAMPTFQLGFKCPAPPAGGAFARWELMAELAVEALMGESSALYLRLYEDGLIDASFGAGVETVDGCAMIVCGGDSYEPEAVRDAIVAEAARLAAQGIPEQTLQRLKRSAYGRRIKDLDSFESSCFRLCACHFDGFDYYEFPALFGGLDSREMAAFLGEHITARRCALAVVLERE